MGVERRNAYRPSVEKARHVRPGECTVGWIVNIAVRDTLESPLQTAFALFATWELTEAEIRE